MHETTNTVNKQQMLESVIACLQFIPEELKAKNLNLPLGELLKIYWDAKTVDGIRAAAKFIEGAFSAHQQHPTNDPQYQAIEQMRASMQTLIDHLEPRVHSAEIFTKILLDYDEERNEEILWMNFADKTGNFSDEWAEYREEHEGTADLEPLARQVAAGPTIIVRTTNYERMWAE